MTERSGHRHFPPPPGNALVIAIEHLGIAIALFGVKVSVIRIGPQTELAPKMLLHGARQAHLHAMLIIEFTPTTGRWVLR